MSEYMIETIADVRERVLVLNNRTDRFEAGIVTRVEAALYPSRDAFVIYTVMLDRRSSYGRQMHRTATEKGIRSMPGQNPS